MEATKARLGRGLDALISGGNDPIPTGAAQLAITQIQHNPYQPRKQFDEEELLQLAESIKEHGILQPLVVRANGEQFQLIAGERRLKAAQLAGLTQVPVHLVEFNDQQVFEAALAENIQRADLNPIEKAQGFKDYLDRFQMSQEQLAAKLGIDRTSVSNLLGLLNLVPEVQSAVRLGQISLGHAKVLKGITDAARQTSLCKQVVLQSLSVRALEALIKEQDAAPVEAVVSEKTPSEKFEKTAHVTGIENELRQKLAVRVEIKVKAQDRGQIVLGFDSNDDFERLVAALQG
ncbi:MAG: ParB/RepB/Spo0J family partition protein [Bacteroidales bacterium]|nr:ParB/RepB/Spo0J family partition protein [Bacteroidales bacterium]